MEVDLRHAIALAVVMTTASACIPRLYSEAGPAGPWSWDIPENSWSVKEPPRGTLGQGYDIGQVVPDFRLEDQFGDEVSLWQFYGDVILLDVSTMWCAPCRDLAAHTEETWADFRGRGFMYVTVLQQDNDGAPPDLADLLDWVDAFGITSPVVGDAEEVTASAIRQGQIPAVLVVGRDLVIEARVGTTDSEVRAAINAAL